MTDKMTAEQIWRDADGIERRIACNELGAPAAFTLMKQLVREALTAPRVPEGWRDTLEKIRELIAGAPIDSLGIGHDEHCGHWPIRDEVVDSLTKLLTAAPAPADYVCHQCGQRTPPPKQFKLYVSCESCGATTSATIAKDLASPAPADALASMERNSYDKIIADQDDKLAAAEARVRELEVALNEYYLSDIAGFPSFEAGKDAQDEWADRRASARNNADRLTARLRGGSDE